MTQPILVLVRDLLFASKITATAQAVGAKVKIVRDPEMLQSESGEKLIVDLNQTGALEAAAAWKAASGGTVIGFVSHVDRETIGRARAAGITDVLARSQFVESLPRLLGRGTEAGGSN